MEAAALPEAELVVIDAIELDDIDSVALLDDPVADFALAVEDADFAELLIESVIELAEAEEIDEAAEEAEEAIVILAEADGLGVIDSTVFLLSITKGAL